MALWPHSPDWAHQVVDRFNTHRIHIWCVYIYIYANIWGILMVNVTIYIAYMDPMGYDSIIFNTFHRNSILLSGIRVFFYIVDDIFPSQFRRNNSSSELGIPPQETLR